MKRLQSSTLRFAVVGLAFFLVVDLVPVGVAGVGFLAAWAFVDPRSIPAMLVLAASIQDARGLAGSWAYVAFGLPAAVFIGWRGVQFLLAGGRMRGVPPAMQRIAGLGACAMVYGVLASVVHAGAGGATQSGARPPYVVGVLMLLMLLAGTLTAVALEEDEALRGKVMIAAYLAVANLLLVAVGQALFGATFGHSPSGLGALETAGQIQEASALGIPRLTGTLGHPNSLPLFVSLIAMIPLVVNRSLRPPILGGLFVLAAGATAGLLALSKAGTALALLGSGAFLWVRLGPRALVLPGVIGAALVASEIDWELWRTALRFEWGTGSYRSQAWAAVLFDFRIEDWIFGRGLSSWQSFFDANIGIPLIDPHTFILSVPGSFGIIGILFYVALGLELAKAYWYGRLCAVRVGALFVGGLLFGKDLVTVPTLIGNTTASFLAWLLLASTLIGAGRLWVQPARAVKPGDRA